MNIDTTYLTDDDHRRMAEEIFYETYGDECDVDREDRRYVDEADVETVTQTDRDDLDAVLAWEEHSFTL